MTSFNPRNLTVLLLLATGCAHNLHHQQVAGLGLESSVLSGGSFVHRVLQPTVPSKGDSKTLIVVLDGDGKAFVSRTRVAKDPTPDRSRVLPLIPALHRLAPSLYLGRPCYHNPGVAQTPCEPRFWTVSRYGETVVQSLAVAIGSALGPSQRALLVGYSGGGVLALLVAERLEDRALAVLTFGAPLDIRAWADWHGYTPLIDSINPADASSKFAGLCQQHLFGIYDRAVSPELVDSWSWPSKYPKKYIASNHHCCWEREVTASVYELLSRC